MAAALTPAASVAIDTQQQHDDENDQSNASSPRAAASIAGAAVSSTKPLHPGAVAIAVRASATRGRVNENRLHGYYTFSFGSYNDSRYDGLHSLRILNEDRIAPAGGFGRHAHNDFEIFSYILSGTLRHEDSMGNKESLGRGSVQFTSTGSGILHSEVNDSDSDPVHLLQVWVAPNTLGLKPTYTTRKWSDAEKNGRLRLIVSKQGGQRSIKLHQDMSVYASILQPGASVTFAVDPQRDVYVHLVQDATGLKTEANKTALTLTDATGGSTKLSGGDGATVRHSTGVKGSGAQLLTLTGAGADGAIAEFLLFDIAQSKSVNKGKKKHR